MNNYKTTHLRSGALVTRRTFAVTLDGRTYQYGAVRGGNGEWQVLAGSYEDGKALGYVYPNGRTWDAVPASNPELTTTAWRTLRDAIEEIVRLASQPA